MCLVVMDENTKQTKSEQRFGECIVLVGEDSEADRNMMMLYVKDR